MNLIKNSQWSYPLGVWKVKGGKLIQSSKEGITTRAYQSIESSDFIASYKMRLSRINQDVWGESKFIFSGADSGEHFRIDFIYTINACRLTIGEVMGKPVQFSTICELIEGKQYSIKITLKDNLLSVYIDGMKIFDNFNVGRRSNKAIGVGSYDARVEFAEIEISAYKENDCFIIMPFDYKRNFLYDYVIKPTLDLHPKLLFKHIRADEALTVGKISEEITEYINQADIVIADITSNNANVFYELGFVHGTKRKALLLIEKMEGEKLNIPFDIQDFRCHTYMFSKEGFEKISKKIGFVLANMIEESKK